MSFLSSILLGLTPVAHAQTTTFSVSKIGFASYGNIQLVDMVGNIVSTAQLTILPIATAMFVVGAFRYTLSGGSDDAKNAGKDFMMGSLMGAAIVLASKGILNFIMFFVYGS